MRNRLHVLLTLIGTALMVALGVMLVGHLYALHMMRLFLLLGVVLWLALLVLFVRFVIQIEKQGTWRTAWLKLALVLSGITVLPCVVFISIQLVQVVSHRDTLMFNGQVYHLAGRFVAYEIDERTLPSHMDYYWQGWLYQCDSSGFFCDLVGEFTMRESSLLRVQDDVLEVVADNGRVTFTYTP